MSIVEARGREGIVIFILRRKYDVFQPRLQHMNGKLAALARWRAVTNPWRIYRISTNRGAPDRVPFRVYHLARNLIGGVLVLRILSRSHGV